jgi:hypothetical protein
VVADATEAHGPFRDRDSTVAASLRPKGSFGYGNVAPDLGALFPRGAPSRVRRHADVRA